MKRSSLKRPVARYLWGRTFGPPYPYRRYNLRTRCVFIHIPKAAGTSVLQSLGAPTTGRTHAPWAHYYMSRPDWFAQFFKFTFVRNPWDRLLSAHQYVVSGGSGSTHDRELDGLFSSQGTFPDFVAGYLTPEVAHRHLLLRPQYTFICDEFLNLKVDFVGRVERLRDDLNEVSRLANLSLKQPPRLNMSSQGAAPFAWDAETVAKVASIYAGDVELFGYAPPRVVSSQRARP